MKVFGSIFLNLVLWNPVFRLIPVHGGVWIFMNTILLEYVQVFFLNIKVYISFSNLTACLILKENFYRIRKRENLWKWWYNKDIKIDLMILWYYFFITISFSSSYLGIVSGFIDPIILNITSILISSKVRLPSIIQFKKIYKLVGSLYSYLDIKY